MKTALVLFFGLVLGVSAQTGIGLRSPFYAAGLKAPAGGTTWYPTNVGTPISWYVAADYATNGGVSLPDRCGNAWHLTNGLAASTPVKTNDGTRTFLFFDGGDHIRNQAYTNPQPHEVWVVANFMNPPASGILFDSCNSSYRNTFQHNSGQWSINAGSSLSSGTGTAITNTWQVFMCVFDSSGAASQLWTNNVLSKSGNAGTQPMSGFTLGAANGVNFNVKGGVAEIVTYSATNLPSNRLLIYQDLTNRYAIVASP